MTLVCLSQSMVRLSQDIDMLGWKFNGLVTRVKLTVCWFPVVGEQNLCLKRGDSHTTCTNQVKVVIKSDVTTYIGKRSITKLKWKLTSWTKVIGVANFYVLFVWTDIKWTYFGEVVPVPSHVSRRKLRDKNRLNLIVMGL